ncbi:hypothetical protein [Nocardia sp. R6R-6]|uniref:hypothetical protein n=1 Tax=Nocardia sp. R6R-6 TaxID=3459303 RepID=UPI00403DE231
MNENNYRIEYSTEFGKSVRATRQSRKGRRLNNLTMVLAPRDEIVADLPGCDVGMGHFGDDPGPAHDPTAWLLRDMRQIFRSEIWQTFHRICGSSC